MSLRLFRSVKFNIGLFLLLVLGAAAGTILPQLPDAPEKVDAFMRAHHGWYRLFHVASLFDVYHSWWFIGFLALMAFDVVVCKLWNAPTDKGLIALPPEVGQKHAEEHVADMEKMIRLQPLRSSFSLRATPQSTITGLRGQISKLGYALGPLLRDAHDRSSFVATRHRAQRWGSYLAHVALVVILSGGLVKVLFGFEEMVPVLDGGSREVQRKPGWEIHVDKFTVQYYKGTSDPKLFASELRVMDGLKLIGKKRITVNDPLDIHGVRFYQASWGAGGMFRKATLDFGGRRLEVLQRVATLIPGTPIRVYADMMLPNFTVTPDGRADTASLDLKNPAVKVHFGVAGQDTRPLWLLMNFPKLALAENKDGSLTQTPTPPFRLASVDPVLFSGIQVGYDPGYPLVLAGAVTWLAGNVLLFYLHRRRLWVLVNQEEPGGSRVVVGAWSSRGVVGFRREFDTMIERLRERTS